MSCLLSYYNTVPFPLQSNLRSVFCTFCIPHLFQLLKNPGCGCAGSVFSHLKCKISTSDCAGSSFFLLKCTISTPDCAEFGFSLLKCTISTPDCAEFGFSLLKCTISTPDCAEFGFSLLKCTISTSDCAEFDFSLLKCTISTPDCAEFGFSLLKCTISTPDCAEFALLLLKCTISPWNYAKQKMFLGISSRQSAALVISHFPQAHAPHPCEVFLLYKRSLSFKTNKKEARSQASSPAAGRLISPILFQPMAILAERFYVIGRTVL